MIFRTFFALINEIYTCNADGLRAAKNVVKSDVPTVTQYVWGIDGLAGFTDGANTVVVLYDKESSPIDFTLNGTGYAYVKNLQGDVLRILDEAGNTVVSYTCDLWGVPNNLREFLAEDDD